MADFAGIYGPALAKPTKVAALATVTSSAELDFPKNRILAIQPVCTAAATSAYAQVLFGYAGTIAAADATAWPIPCGTVQVFDMTEQFTAIRIFNASSANMDIYIQELSRSS